MREETYWAPNKEVFSMEGKLYRALGIAVAISVALVACSIAYEARAQDEKVAAVQPQEDAERNPVPQLEVAIPIPSMEYFVEEYDRLVEQIVEGGLEPHFFGEKYRYCQVIPEAYRVVRCKDCVSRLIGGEGDARIVASSAG